MRMDDKSKTELTGMHICEKFYCEISAVEFKFGHLN